MAPPPAVDVVETPEMPAFAPTTGMFRDLLEGSFAELYPEPEEPEPEPAAEGEEGEAGAAEGEADAEAPAENTEGEAGDGGEGGADAAEGQETAIPEEPNPYDQRISAIDSQVRAHHARVSV